MPALHRRASGEIGQGAWIGAWADRIETLGLSSVALPLMELARAFGFLGSQVLLVVEPLMGGVVSDKGFERASMLLSNPEMLEQLRRRLSEERDQR